MVQIDGPQAHHLAHVLRVSPGFEVTCFDGRGAHAQAVVRSVSRKGVSLELGQRRTLPTPPWAVSLAVAIPKKGKLDQIVDQATQLGVHRLIPLLTARGVVRLSGQRLRLKEASPRPSGQRLRLKEASPRPSGQDWSKKQARLTQIAIESCKQSGLDRLPILDPPIPWDDFVRSVEGYDRILMATVEGPHEDLEKLLSHGPVATVLLLIGPEGDWTPEEIRQADQVGAHRISLGPTVLRCETAVVAGLSIVTHSLRTGGSDS